MTPFQTLVIGGGQAGLAAGWQLAQQGIDFVILEASGQPGGAWRNYYDSLMLFSPARYSSLPGLPFPGAPAHYPDRDEVVAYLKEYARQFSPALRTRQRVASVTRTGDGFEVATTSGERYRAQTVIAASGTFVAPNIPAIDGLHQFGGRALHSADYRNPAGFAGHHVIVIGAANSAVQIATELASVARVTLATRQPVRFFPQHLLGLDFHFWVKWSGLENTRWLSDQSTPVLDTGKYRHALQTGLVPRRKMFTRITERGVFWSDGSVERADDLLFATGFRPALQYLEGLCSGQMPAYHNGIVRQIPGLYCVGFPGQRNFASATLRGVGADAAYIMPHLLAQLHSSRRRSRENGVPDATAHLNLPHCATRRWPSWLPACCAGHAV